jgi:hypothetical protein
MVHLLSGVTIYNTTVMQNKRSSSLLAELLYAKSQEENHVIFKVGREIFIYMDVSRRDLLGFYINYESIS